MIFKLKQAYSKFLNMPVLFAQICEYELQGMQETRCKNICFLKKTPLKKMNYANVP